MLQDDKGGRQQPMMKSFVSKDDANRFTFSNPITHILYDVEEDKEFPDNNPLLLITTHLPMTIPHVNGKRFTGRGVLQQVKANFCCLDLLAKLIALFGFKPKERSSGPLQTIHTMESHGLKTSINFWRALMNCIFIGRQRKVLYRF